MYLFSCRVFGGGGVTGFERSLRISQLEDRRLKDAQNLKCEDRLQNSLILRTENLNSELWRSAYGGLTEKTTSFWYLPGRPGWESADLHTVIKLLTFSFLAVDWLVFLIFLLSCFLHSFLLLFTLLYDPLLSSSPRSGESRGDLYWPVSSE